MRRKKTQFWHNNLYSGAVFVIRPDDNGYAVYPSGRGCCIWRRREMASGQWGEYAPKRISRAKALKIFPQHSNLFPKD